MANCIDYHFSDFTYDNYRRLLKLARTKYTFRSFLDFKEAECFVIWRHDVDYSMHAALRLARIEAEEDVSCTYLFNLHSELYNLLEREITHIGREILKLGHSLGVHFDCNFYNIANENELIENLTVEKNLLTNIFHKEIYAFSFHNPTPAILTFNERAYAGLINSYSSFFQNEVGYCSDSNGYWRHRRLEDVLQEGHDLKLQVLTHPEWWQEEIMSPKQRIDYCIDGRAKNNKKWYNDLIIKDGRRNIDWL